MHGAPEDLSLTYSKAQNPLILCVINGDEKIFMKDLVIQGQAGGKTAAQQLTKAIAEYLSKEELHIFGRLSFWTTIYVNKSDLFTKLLGHDFCTAEQFDNFFYVSRASTSLRRCWAPLIYFSPRVSARPHLGSLSSILDLEMTQLLPR